MLVSSVLKLISTLSFAGPINWCALLFTNPELPINKEVRSVILPPIASLNTGRADTQLIELEIPGSNEKRPGYIIEIHTGKDLDRLRHPRYQRLGAIIFDQVENKKDTFRVFVPTPESVNAHNGFYPFVTPIAFINVGYVFEDGKVSPIIPSDFYWRLLASRVVPIGFLHYADIAHDLFQHGMGYLEMADTPLWGEATDLMRHAFSLIDRGQLSEAQIMKLKHHVLKSIGDAMDRDTMKRSQVDHDTNILFPMTEHAVRGAREVLKDFNQVREI